MMQSISSSLPMAGQTKMSGQTAAVNIPDNVSDGVTEGSAGETQDDCDFGGAMAAAEMMASAAASAPRPQPGLKGDQVQLSGSSVTKEQASKDGVTREASKFEKAGPIAATLAEDKSALIQKMAVGSNTGAEIAGLKPWSKDWVLEGGMNRHPMQKTLLDGAARGESADPASRLAELARLVQASAAKSQGSVIPTIETVDGAQAELMELDDLGGDVGPATAPAPGSPNAVRKQMSGNDFLSIRQGGTPEMVPNPASESGMPVVSGAPASKSSKPIAGGIKAPVGQGMLSRPNGGIGKDLLKDQEGASSSAATSTAKDTLGLIHPEMNAKGGVGLNRSALPFAAAPGALQLSGSVVPGTLQRNRLSSESVMGVSQGIRELKASGGGEIRLRLKPDHLGEIHVKVTTGGRTGSEVGLQIQASDDRAKKILEESMGSLKESLAGQSLTLSKVDVQVATSNRQDGQFGQNSASQDGTMMGRNSSQGDMGQGGSSQRETGSGDAGTSDGFRPAMTRSASQAFSGASRSSAAASGAGRLDVIA